jgi:hypothetical protein
MEGEDNKQSSEKKDDSTEALTDFLEIIKVFPLYGQCELLQLINGLRPVAQVAVMPEYEETMLPAIERLKGLGLRAVSYKRPAGKAGEITEFFISKDLSLAEQALASQNDSKRFGELMGYPASSVEEFISNKDYLSDDELTDLIGFENHFFNLKFSKSHSEDALEYLRKSYKVLLEQAPYLLEEGLPLHLDKKNYISKVAEFVYRNEKPEKLES